MAGEQRRIAAVVVEGLEPKIQDALAVLAKAHVYARSAAVDVWEFSLEIERLLALGLETIDLRWLVWMGYLEHAREITKPDDPERRFQRSPNNAFPRRTCFVLTEEGLLIAGRAGAGRVVSQLAAAGSPDSNRSEPMPRWDRGRRTLFVGDQMVKQFKLPSPNQEAILDAFEKEAWVQRIFDPLQPQDERVAKQRLRWTINRLNRHQEHPLIRFFTDGSGQVVCWELVESVVRATSTSAGRKKLRMAA